MKFIFFIHAHHRSLAASLTKYTEIAPEIVIEIRLVYDISYPHIKKVKNAENAEKENPHIIEKTYNLNSLFCFFKEIDMYL